MNAETMLHLRKSFADMERSDKWNAATWRALFEQSMPDRRRDIFLLMTAFQEGVVGEMLPLHHSVVECLERERWCDLLRECTGIESSLAIWTIDCWCEILTITVTAKIPQPAPSTEMLKVVCNRLRAGDYIYFGRYDNEPILWRVIHNHPDGSPLLLSDKIITFKAFDARGTYHNDDERRRNGSNEWAPSNLRQWLNSCDRRTSWIQNKPNTVNMKRKSLSYALEPGYLHVDRFTEQERDLIATNDEDDRVFCLTIAEWQQYVYDGQGVLGSDYHRAVPTLQAAALLNPKEDSINQDGYWFYWLRTPHETFPYYVRAVSIDGKVRSREASTGLGGVRPALSLKVDATSMEMSGSGTLLHPYCLRF